MIEKVNYNEISPVYNVRYNVSPLEGVLSFLKNIVETYSPKNILEIGCGTGHWLKELSNYEVQLFGGDYSIGMLKQAFRDPIMNIHLFNTDANFLPLRRNSFDLIICVNAIHHFSDKKKFVIDSSSFLKNNGIISIIGLDPRDTNVEWSLYKYFDRTYQIDLNRFPSFDDISRWMEMNRCNRVEKKLVHTVDKIISGRDVLKDHFLDKRGASQLALLSDSEYQNGITKIKSDIEKAESEGKEFEFVIKLNFFSITGYKN
jgi:SAM-dependent methyltransferase